VPADLQELALSTNPSRTGRSAGSHLNNRPSFQVRPASQVAAMDIWVCGVRS
jgi:hypothetical protein